MSTMDQEQVLGDRINDRQDLNTAKNWFDGPAFPVNLFKDDQENQATVEPASDEDKASDIDASNDEAWSEDSENSDDSC